MKKPTPEFTFAICIVPPDEGGGEPKRVVLLDMRRHSFDTCRRDFAKIRYGLLAHLTVPADDLPYGSKTLSAWEDSWEAEMKITQRVLFIYDSVEKATTQRRALKDALRSIKDGAVVEK